MCGSTPSSIRRAPGAIISIELARRVAEGGATLVQLRDKGSETRAMIDKARAIMAALSSFRCAFCRQ